MKTIIDQLHTHSVEAIDRETYEIVEENIAMIKELYVLLIEVNNVNVSNEIVDHIDSVVNDIFVRYWSKDKFQDAVFLLVSIYEPVLRSRKFVYMDDELRMILKYIKKSSYLSEGFLTYIKKLFSLIYLAASDKKGKEINYVSQINTNFYYAIFKNTDLKGYDRESILRDLAHEISFLKGETKSNELKMRMLKTMIDNKDIINFKIAAKWSFISSENPRNMILTLSIYLYYLVYKEDLVDGKKFAQFLELELFKDLESQLRFEETDLDVIKVAVSEELSSWERMPEEEAKWMIMDSVIREFIFFIGCSIQTRFLNELDQDETSSMLMQFHDEAKGSVLERYTVFKKVFHIYTPYKNIEELDGGIQKLKEKHTQFEMIDLSNLENTLKVNENQELFTLEEMERKLIIKNFEKNTELKTVKKNLPIMIPTIVFQSHNLNTLIDGLIKNLIRNINRDFFNALGKSKVKIKSTSIKRLNKLDLLLSNSSIELVENQNSKIITNIDPDSYFLFLEAEDSKEEYKKILSNSKVVMDEFTFNPYYWLNIRGGNIFYNIENLNLIVRSMTEKEVMNFLQQYKIAEELFALPIINNIKKEFGRKEAAKFVSLKYKIIEVSIDVGFDAEKIEGELIYFY